MIPQESPARGAGMSANMGSTGRLPFGPHSGLCAILPRDVRLPHCAVNATTRFVLVAALLAVASAGDVRAAAKTVCTVTVNSPDERETFRRALPRGDFEFIELVERGRPDWLAVGVPPADSLRRSHHLRPFRRRQRVLLGPPRRARAPSR